MSYLKNICYIYNGKPYLTNDNGKNTLYNGGLKTYTTNGESNLIPNTEYIIIHKQSASVSFINKSQSATTCIGNNAFYITLKEDEKCLLKYLYYVLKFTPKILKQLQKGAVQPSINKTDISNLEIEYV